MTRLRRALLLPLVLVASHADAAPLLLEQMNLLTLLESSTTVMTTLGNYAVQNPDGITNGNSLLSALSWSGAYTSAGWRYTATGLLGGVALTMNYTGTLSGSDGGHITVDFSGTGMLGTMPLLMNGATNWLYDAAAEDYLAMEFEQETKIGTGTRWAWSRGQERIKCPGPGDTRELIGGGSVLIAVASSGKRSALGKGMKKCAFEDATTRRGTLLISTMVTTALTADRQAKPALPPLPDEGNLFDSGYQGTLMTDDGRLFADDGANAYRSAGRYTEGIGGTGGTVEGSAFSIPEPAPAALLGLALLASAGFRPRRTEGAET